MYRLHWHRISVTLFRAHCVYAWFGSLSAPGGNAPSSKSLPATPWRKLLKKAELAALTGTSPGPCTTTLLVFGPAPAVLKPNEPPEAHEAAAGGLCCTSFGEEQAEGRPELASLGKPPTGEGTGGCSLPTLDFSPHSMCMCVHVDKVRKGTAATGKKAG